MPVNCQLKRRYGKEFCITDCPARGAGSGYRFARVEGSASMPPADPKTIDVAVLDMNHGWPNLGHDSLVASLVDACCDLAPELLRLGLQVRAISFDVRGSAALPDPPGERFALYLGTGGPGHLDPRENDGLAEHSQGLREDPAWRAPAFELFDRILADRSAALLAVCHTFGVLCDWSGIARPVLRSPEKGGKSTGVLENMFTPEAIEHPWFRRFYNELGGPRLRILDNRLFDLIPDPENFPGSGTPIGYETESFGGPIGPALTMYEFDRDEAGVMPRIFGVNHHPEIINRARQMLILERRVERGEVSRQWAAERREILTRVYSGEDSDYLLQLTSNYTLLAPMRYHLYRQIRLRAESLGLAIDLHEDQALNPISFPACDLDFSVPGPRAEWGAGMGKLA
ncbi:MAG TPA: hypothetical protein VGS22_18295 [Thermoanaerobaculia bacterium]|jgi:hypothetical protein|nr:hypothetical protein [Thermoanaerobaculia bacterium]